MLRTVWLTGLLQEFEGKAALDEFTGMTSLALAVPLTVVSVLGLLLNIYILFVVLVTKQVQTANNLLLLHLGAVDALLCVTFLVFSAPEMLKGWPWLALGAPCNLHGFLFTLLHPVALWTVCGLNCDRYYAIASPLHYGSVVNPKKVAIGLGCTWLVSLILCIPPLFLVAPYKFNPGLGGCAPDFGEKDGAMWYSLTYTTFTLLLPAVLILGCNLRVLMIARYHRHRIASAIFEVTISAQVTITHQRNPFFLPSGNVFRGRSAISTVLQLIGSFLILYFPYYGVILWESSSSMFISEWKASSTSFHTLMVTLASTLLNCSPPVNGLLYGVKSKILRKSFQNYWRKQMSKSEMNQEIQARTPSTCGSRRPSLTPVGFLARPASSHLQRRSSEVYLERRSSSSRSSSQRMASELAWRPQSTTGINLESMEPLRKSKSLRDGSLSKHSSCNVLQVPEDEDVLGHLGNHSENQFPTYKLFKVAVSKKFSDCHEGARRPPIDGTRPSKSSSSRGNVLVHATPGVGSSLSEESGLERQAMSAPATALPSAPRRSPRILVTRAFSEETDQPPSRSSSPIRSELLTRSCSSSTTSLGDRKWKRPRYWDEGEAADLGPCGAMQSQVPSASAGSQKSVSGTDRSSDSNSEDETDGGGGMHLTFGTICDSPERRKSRNLERRACAREDDGFRRDGRGRGLGSHAENLPLMDHQCSSQAAPSYLFSWPFRRKNCVSCGSSAVVLTRSATNLGGVSEFQL